MTTELSDIHKDFSGNVALDGVSLTVTDGEFVAILGPSGCGKTTLLRILAGFEAPTTGEVRIDGRVVGSPDVMVPTERRNLGMVFQSFALWPHLSVAAHVKFPLTYQRSLDEDIRADRGARIDEVLRITGLGGLRDRMPHQLSGGQRQRVALARAIASRPSLLLMDEPLSALDAALREEMRREIQNLHRATGASIVYVTHDQAEALAMADRIVVMRDGRVEQVGTPDEVYNRPATSFVATFVGKANLVEGTWDGEEFLPKQGGGRVRWNGKRVAESFRSDGLFPVRPDELEPCDVVPGADDVVVGTVRNAQFQGREVHYVVDVDGTDWLVYSGAHAAPGEQIGIRLRGTT
ncbi:MAG TPA: ABC transporter ATP-binding protein [Actinomycetales bacterium]|nr:ABC transporter ATP-binding protein [Actinomycetales bacterium]